MQVRCANCGGAIPLERDDAFLRCPFCDSTLYLDRAATFLRFELAAPVSEVRAKDLLGQALAGREIAPQPVKKVERLRLPFWAVRGAEATTTEPAFAPLPPGFVGFRIPAGRPLVAREGDEAGFEPVASSSAADPGEEEEGSPPGNRGLYFLPFYRVSYGTAEPAFEAWIDAAGGDVLLGETPPSDTQKISRRSMRALWILLGACAVETALIPSPGIGFLAVAVTAAAAYPLLKGVWDRETST